MTGYTPADFAGQLGGAVLVILPWIGVAVAAGLALFFVYLGIRSGIKIFLGTTGGYDKDGNWSGPSSELDDYEKSKSASWGDEVNDALDYYDRVDPI